MSNQAPTRIAILGASFDPPHYAHAALAAIVLHERLCDEVWLCPSLARWDKTPLAPLSLRVEWARLLAHEMHEKGLQVSVSEEEQTLGTFRGTYLFLRHLQQTFTNLSFLFCMGFDSWQTISTWRDPQTNSINGHLIAQEFDLLLFPRAVMQKTTGIIKQDIGGRSVTILKPLSSYRSLFNSLFPNISPDFIESLSSSDIRSRLAEGTSPGDFCFPVVYDRIVSTNPY